MSISFPIKNSTRGLWKSLSKSNYVDCLQPFLELLDNSFSAIPTRIEANLNSEACIGSIEDNGKGFGIDIPELTRCFTWGPDETSPVGLNEHGCGMKSSLAILDPLDSGWKVCWKHNGLIYSVSAPYSKDGNFEAVILDTWPGSMNGPTGSFIQFPFKKENLRSLYDSGKSASFKMVFPKLSMHLSHYWMFHHRFVTGQTELWLNHEQVRPFTMPMQDANLVTKVTNYTQTLACGAHVFMQDFMLKDSLQGSPWFKKSMGHNGVYIFKNGRMIKKIVSGLEYKNIMGSIPHNNHNGMIVLVNVTGEPASLPVTVPTKNDFDPNNNPNYYELIEYIKKTITPPVIEKSSEESLLNQFEKHRTAIFNSAGISHTFLTKEYIKCSNSFSTPQLDAVEEFDSKINIYEAKKDNRLCLQTILQMYGNYILAAKALDTLKKVVPIILINCSDMTIDDSHKNTIAQLASNSLMGFPVEVWNYDAEVLWKYNM
jgi:hypothetical protein